MAEATPGPLYVNVIEADFCPFDIEANCAGTIDNVTDWPDVPLEVTVNHGTVDSAVQFRDAPVLEVVTLRWIDASDSVEVASMVNVGLPPLSVSVGATTV